MIARRRDAWVLAFLAAVPALLFLDVFRGVNAFYVRDMLRYHFPGKKVLREIVLSGQFPYWNPWISAGQPMAANPAHEVFYPLTWLILLPDYAHALQLLPLLHIVIATFTMYALLRSMELGRPAAAIGALSFGIGGLLCSMLTLLHFLFSVSWLPLTCLYTRRALLLRSARDGALAALFLGLQLLAGEPTTVLETGVLLGMYAIYRGMQDGRTPAAVARRVAVIGAISIGACLVAAVLVIPMLDHFGDTSRARGIEYEHVRHWSMPFMRVAELVYPTFFGRDGANDHSHYWAAAKMAVPFYFSIYSGLLLTVMAAAGLLARSRGGVLVSSIAAISIIGAMGDHTPLLRILYDAGIATSLRYPEKFILMLVFTIIVFGAQSLDRLLTGDARVRRMALIAGGGITIFAAATALFSWTSAYAPFFRRVWSVERVPTFDEMLQLSRQGWLTATVNGVLLILLLASVNRLRRPLWVAMAVAFVIVDLGPIASEVAPRVPMAFFRETPAVVRQLPQRRDDFRIFHMAQWSNEDRNPYLRPDPDLYWILRNSIPPLLPAAYGLRSALEIDFDGTELEASSEFTRAAWMLQKARPKEALRIVAAMSNVRYVVVYRPYDEGIALGHGVTRNVQPVRLIAGRPNPRYYFASEMGTARDADDFVRKVAAGRFGTGVAFVADGAFAPARGEVRSVREWTNGARIDVAAAGRAFLVMSVTPHKYWRITIDGKPARAVVTNIGYQGVEVPPGSHVIEMRYRNPLIAIGGAISIAALAVVFVFCRMRRL
ncbi:MAG: hypothetical protein ACJ74H_16265 [Thermoanaerobaculia bacterium]